jgi:hypothetical protein
MKKRRANEITWPNTEFNSRPRGLEMLKLRGGQIFGGARLQNGLGLSTASEIFATFTCVTPFSVPSRWSHDVPSPIQKRGSVQGFARIEWPISAGSRLGTLIGLRHDGQQQIIDVAKADPSFGSLAPPIGGQKG